MSQGLILCDDNFIWSGLSSSQHYIKINKITMHIYFIYAYKYKISISERVISSPAKLLL